MAAESAPTAPTVLITGTSSGIGLAAAVALAAAGRDVVATLRDPARATALLEAAAAAGVTLDVVALDVTDPQAVERVVAEAADRHGGLDAVVNNAGAASLGTVENVSLEQIRPTPDVATKLADVDGSAVTGMTSTWVV